MASNDFYLRSDADKGEVSPDKDLRLRSDTDKEQVVTYYHGFNIQGVGELALCDVGNSFLRVRKSGVTYGLGLVDVSDPNASAVRIKIPAGIKAIRKYT